MERGILLAIIWHWWNSPYNFNPDIDGLFQCIWGPIAHILLATFGAVLQKQREEEEAGASVYGWLL